MRLNLMIKTSPLIERAMAFAREKHKDQLRKYTLIPYWTHVEDVADLVAGVTDDERVIAAAILHDTVEDTDTTLNELADAFGARVASLVDELTDRYADPALGNRAKRKAKECERLAMVSIEAMTIKLADLIDNTKTITFYDPKFAPTYLKEKAALLEVLKAGDPTLWKLASEQVKEGCA